MKRTRRNLSGDIQVGWYLHVREMIWCYHDVHCTRAGLGVACAELCTGKFQTRARPVLPPVGPQRTMQDLGEQIRGASGWPLVMAPEARRKLEAGR